MAPSVTFVAVVAVRRITPRTARIALEGEALADTAGTAPDRQPGLRFPRPGQREPLLPARQGDPTGRCQAYLAIPEAERRSGRGVPGCRAADE
ncbi:siderophore-interacting protein [Kitasatospora sp. NPDC001159]